jgi:hypothetical protein
MQWKNFAVAATLLLWLSGAASAGCMPGDKIDKTTAADAKKKIAAAGYTKVSDLTKGCDNFWHGKAMKAGAAVNIVLSPEGQVMTEGD